MTPLFRKTRQFLNGGIRFFGSLFFALFLIAFTLLFVILGTFLESWTQSHLFAAQLTYQNPVFQLLLWLYFLNILCAALSRYPFKKRHIPFLLTHLGLLLLLLGVFVKNHYGVQGSLVLTEGSGTSHILLPNTYALQITAPQISSLIGLKKEKLGPIQCSGHPQLNLSLLEWIPHAEERYEGFIKGNYAHLIGLPPIEVGTFLDTPECRIFPLRFENVESIAFPGFASLFLIEDDAHQEHLVAFNQSGEKYVTSLHDIYYVYDKGFGGYGMFAELPASFPSLELITPLTRITKACALPIKREEQTPHIRIKASDGKHSELIALTYDKFSQKFMWPILGGKYLVRFQSNQKQLPFHLRLKKAKQINYPETLTPYSYEAYVQVEDQEICLSMNHVYEKKGYRFYLANLLPLATGVNQVHIVVNFDPAKYVLTYPAAIILALGMILLYLRKHYV